HKPAYVRAPVRNARKRRINSNGNVDLQRLPGGINITGPEERGIALHAGVTVAMECVGSLIRAIDLRPFPVHLVPNQTRCDVQRIALVGPPSIHSHREVLAVSVPVTASLLLVKLGRFAPVMYGSTELVGKDHGMKHHAEMIFVQLIDHGLRIRESTRVPCKGSVLRVPSRGTKARAQVDQGIAGQLLFTKGLDFGENFLATAQGAMRLLVAEPPSGRHLGVAGE